MIDWIEQNIGLKTFLLIIGIILLIVGFCLGNKFHKQSKLDENKCISNAIVTNMTLRKVKYKNIYEVIEKTIAYNITYIFHLKNKEYSKTQIVKFSSETKRLFNNFTKGDSCFIEIRYSLKNPSESIISKPIFQITK